MLLATCLLALSRRLRSANDRVRKFTTRRALLSPAEVSMFADDARDVDAEAGSNSKFDASRDRDRDRVETASSSSSEEVSSQSSRIARGVRHAAGDLGGRSDWPSLESNLSRETGFCTAATL